MGTRGGTAVGREVLRSGLRVAWLGVRQQPRLFTVAVAGSVLFTALIVASAYVVGWVVGEVAVPAIETGQVAAGSLALAVGVLLGLTGLRVVSMVARRLAGGYAHFRLQAGLRQRVTRQYLRMPVAWHHRHATGTLLSNANSDVEATWAPVPPLPFAIGTLTMLAVAVPAVFLTDPALGLVALAVFPALMWLNLAYSRRMAPRQALAQQLRAEVSAVGHESFDGALVVKTMGREAAETGRFADRAYALRDALIRVGRLRGLFDPLLDALPHAGSLVVLLVGAWRLSQGAIDVAALISVAYLFSVMSFPVRAIGWVLGELPRSAAGWERVRRVLTATGQMRYGPYELDGHPEPARLRFADVSFSYGAREGAVEGTVEGAVDREAVLHDVLFEVPPGATVALVGPTGSGKSTIASLTARLLDPDSGTVWLDGTDARELTAQSLASTVALVPQVAFGFDDTVRANVSLDRPGIADQAVWEALRLAQADRFVAALPDGLDTLVGERGTSLSGGQRQRLTLARALAGNPRLLVLDDATSAVDPRVEAEILAGLRRNRTSILVVAYRRATIALADEVVYLEHGRVVARGSHLDLLASVPGYANLVTAYERAEAERERERAYDEAGAAADGTDEATGGAGVAADGAVGR